MRADGPFGNDAGQVDLSKLAPRDVKDLRTLVRRAACLWKQETAFIFDATGERITFDEVDQRTDAIAAGLDQLGVRQGDRVAVMLRNQGYFPLAWLSIAKLGAIMVPINIYYQEVDAGYVLAHSGAQVLITADEHLPVIHRVSDPDLRLQTILTVDGASRPGIRSLQEVVTVASTPPEREIYPETICNIQYTSGTTGRPKGCMLTHLYWNVLVQKLIYDYPALSHGDVVLTAQPFYYMDPQWNTVATLISGARLVVLDRFHPTTFWSKIRDYRVNFFYCLGMMPALMLKMDPDPRDRDNRLRAIACSAIPAQLHRDLEERWGVPWYETYGMTEIGGGLRVKPEFHDEVVGTGCIGTVQDFREVRVVDEEDKILPRGETGELVVRGVALMDGYYKDPDATREVFRNGWFHTGDVVRSDILGRFYYVGRKKDMIRRSGENIAASEIEETLGMHPAVKMAACVPVPDEVRGEEVKAYVVLEPGFSPESVAPPALAAFCSQRLAYFKVPRYWAYRQELPKTPSERVAKAQLVAEAEDLRVGAFDNVDAVWR